MGSREGPRAALASLVVAAAAAGFAAARDLLYPGPATAGLAVPAWVGAAVLVATASAWTVRLARARRANAAPARPMSAEAMAALVTLPTRGLGADGEGPRWGWQAWVRLRDASAPRFGARLQRVTWHPALDRLRPGTAVSVHGRLDGSRGVVVVLPDGVRLCPVGPLRAHAPRWALLIPRRDARTHLREDAWLRPSPDGARPDGAEPDGAAPDGVPPHAAGGPRPGARSRRPRAWWPGGGRALLLGAAASALPSVAAGPPSTWPSWLAVGLAASVSAHGLLVDEP